MKRITTLLSLLAVCMIVLAQVKLTPQAQLKVASERVKTHKAQPQVTLVVKVAEENARETFAQLRAAGATVLSKIGRQAVVSLPAKNVKAVARMRGIERIDTPHKGKKMTDVTLKATGVSLIDGTTAGSEFALTGKGVTVCVIDQGFDFQHPAFKDSQGRSRIKCVYLMNDDNGHKFVVHDDEAGDIEMPGSIYDTPELIATLQTDNPSEMHGTHTAGITVGSRSPLGYGGMAPDADIVLVPIASSEDGDEGDDELLRHYKDAGDDEEDEDDEDEQEKVIETALAFARAYAVENNLNMVVSASLNSHDGPHDGTGTIPEAIEELSHYAIPVFSSGNEGSDPIHIYKKFTVEDDYLRALLEATDSDNPQVSVVGFSRGTVPDKSVTIVSLALEDPESGNLLWDSKALVLTSSLTEEEAIIIKSIDDEELAKYFDGMVGVGGVCRDGKLGFQAMVEGEMLVDDLSFTLAVLSEDGVDFDLWEQGSGFQSSDNPRFTSGDSDLSGGDWTTIPRVISVGAYCANNKERTYSGEASPMGPFIESISTVGDIAFFSSYGEYPNGTSQPTVCAPGVFIVSAWNHFEIPETSTVLPAMQWQAYPYGSECGTSMSCPVVSGIIALWLQANPSLDFDGVMDVLANASTTDDFTAAEPEKWGFGKISASKGLEYIVKATTGIAEAGSSSRSAAPCVYDLQGRKVGKRDSKLQSGLYIQNGRKYIAK